MSVKREPTTDSERPFQGLLGTTSELILAQHFVATRDLHYTQVELAKATGLTRQTVASTLTRLLEWELVASEVRGRERRFHLNTESPIAYALDTLTGAIIERITGVDVLSLQSKVTDYKSWATGSSNERHSFIPQEKSFATSEPATSEVVAY